MKDRELGTLEFPRPIEATVGHIERLLFATDDLLKGLAHALLKPEPSWFGHLSIVRSAVESMSRVWYLSDGEQPALEISRRLCNEHLYELNQMDSNLSGAFSSMSEDAITQARHWVSERRTELTRWAEAHRLKVNGYIGSRRPKPTYLLAEIYGSNLGDTPEFSLLGAWHYSELSSAAHGLPKGMS